MKTDAEKWLLGEISTGLLINNGKLEACYSSASDCLGGIMVALSDRLQALDNDIERLINDANALRELAEKGDTERTTKDDIELQSARIFALKEARSLLRFHLFGLIYRQREAKEVKK